MWGRKINERKGAERKVWQDRLLSSFISQSWAQMQIVPIRTKTSVRTWSQFGLDPRIDQVQLSSVSTGWTESDVLSAFCLELSPVYANDLVVRNVKIACSYHSCWLTALTHEIHVCIEIRFHPYLVLYVDLSLVLMSNLFTCNTSQNWLQTVIKYDLDGLHSDSCFKTGPRGTSTNLLHTLIIYCIPMPGGCQPLKTHSPSQADYL